MTYEDFRKSLDFDAPPSGLAPLLAALWHLEKGDWHRSHEIAQAIESADAAWVHAHLHRVEGDVWNADYWYRLAGRERPDTPLDDERANIVAALLESS